MLGALGVTCRSISHTLMLLHPSSAFIMYDCDSSTWFVKAEQDFPLMPAFCEGSDCDHYVKMNEGGVLANPHKDGVYFEDETGWELSFPGSRAPSSGVIDLRIHANVFEARASQTSGTSDDGYCDKVIVKCSAPDVTADDIPAPVAAPVASPVSSPVTAPVAAPVTAPVRGTPVAAPVAAPVRQPVAPPTTASGGGDPHFKTWSGHKFDFHGECDLVLVENAAFANGLGLKVHIRTTRKRFYSFIERTALQIGDDIIEFGNSNTWYLNGKQMNGQGSVAGFQVWPFPHAVSIRLDESIKAKIDFIARNNGTPYLFLDGAKSNIFEGSLGMLGDWTNGAMLGRDGQTVISDPEAFAREWQVRPSEDGVLFQDEQRAPQYPAFCTMPTEAFPTRLGNSLMKQAAEKACAGWGDEKDECIFDVMATRDIRAADDVSLVG
jgi:hypothetical protein